MDSYLNYEFLYLQYQFYSSYIDDEYFITTHNCLSISNSNFEKDSDGTSTYSFTIYKDYDSYKYLLFRISSAIKGEITISF